MRVWAQNVQTSHHITGISKKQGIFKNWLRYIRNVSKIKKIIFFWCVLALLLRSSSLWWGRGYIPLWQIFLRILYLFDSISSEIVWSISCIISMKEFFSLTMVAMEIGKRHGCCKEKKLDQKLESYRFKLPLQKLG